MPTKNDVPFLRDKAGNSSGDFGGPGDESRIQLASNDDRLSGTLACGNNEWRLMVQVVPLTITSGIPPFSVFIAYVLGAEW
jgi:hypothetical protein